MTAPRRVRGAGDRDGRSGSEEDRTLRREAEARVASLLSEGPDSGAVDPDIRLLHELQVHQVELEMQNEELRRARDEASSLHEKYLDLYDFAPVGYLTLDPEGAIREANLAGATLLGVPRGELPRRRLALLLEAESRPALAAFLADVAAGRHGVACDVSLSREGREPCRLELGGAAFAEGRELRVTMVDVTERRRAEELRAEVAAERHASELVRLLNEKLRREVESAEAANRELEAFSYSVAHDLRSPVRAVDGYASLLAARSEASLDAEGRRLLAAVRTNSARMGRLIDDLLDLSRVGRRPLVLSDVDVAALARSVVADLAPDDDGGRLEVTIGDLPPVHADEGLLRVVLKNLVSNALKFSACRSPAVIELGYAYTPKGAGYFVRDNGVGFEQSQASRAFRVFQRLHEPDLFEGTGIGLSLVKRIVERHGGATWAVGEVDRGATFWFSLLPVP